MDKGKRDEQLSKRRYMPVSTKSRMSKCKTNDGRTITIEEVMIPTDKLASTHEVGFGN